MHDYEAGVIQGLFKIEIGFIQPDIDPRQHRGDFLERLFAAVTERVEPTPAIGWFVNDDVVSERIELARDAAEEMGIAIIPARSERMTEQDAFHAVISNADACGWATRAAGRAA